VSRSYCGMMVLIVSVGLWLVLAAPVQAQSQDQSQDQSQPEEQADQEEVQQDRLGDQPTGAAADTLVAPADSSVVRSLSALNAQAQSGLQQELDSEPFLQSFDVEPSSGIGAEVRKVRYWGELSSTASLEKNARVTATAGYSWDEYRKQDKTVELRDGTVNHNTGTAFPFIMSMNVNWNWKEDQTVNSAGVFNVNKSDVKRGSINLRKPDITMGFMKHAVFLDGSLRDQKGESQGKRTDSSEGISAGGLASTYKVLSSMTLATGIWRQHNKGEGALGEETSPISTDEDSLRFGTFYRRGLWKGYFNVKRTNYIRRYLDYNRNTAGLVDTTTPGVQKIVNELEEKDAISLEWANQFRLGRVGVGWYMARDTGTHGYQASGVGDRERLQDQVTADLSYRYSAQDSVTFSFGYLWKWDDQRVRDATAARGRQINKKRDFFFDWNQHLFQRTSLYFKFSQGLSQDIAENRFNENDRDRLETHSSLQVSSDWEGRFRANMLFSYRQVQDLSIRESRSSNNNVKDTFEISPGYAWPVASWVSFQQNFLISIQYTEFVFSYLPQVSRDNNYNKRGTLNTKVSFTLNERLKLIVSHDYNARFNATRTMTDATGKEFYHIDLEQRISTLDFAMSYQASPWLKLEGATFRTKDVKDSFGRTDSTVDNRSGEVWLGATVNKSWGHKNPLTLAGTARNYHAYGPNVQESNKEYWDANLTLSWQF